MGLFDGTVRSISSLIGVSAAGRAAATASIPVALSNEDKTALDNLDAGISAIAPSTPYHATLNIAAASAVTAAQIVSPPATGGLRLSDITFSTDSALTMALYQAIRSQYTAACVADGATHFWELDEASGNAVDSVGGDAAGTITLTATGSPAYQSSAQVTANGYAVSLNGTTDYFVNTSTVPTSITTGTIEAWVYLTTIQTAHILNVYDTTNNRFIATWLTGGSDGAASLFFRVASGSNLQATPAFRFFTNTWYHVAWTQDGSGLDCYINGKLNDDLTFSFGTSSSNLWYDDVTAPSRISIGAQPSTPTFFFPGKICMVGWYPSALSAAQILEHYRLGAPLFGPHKFAANSGNAEQLKSVRTLVDGQGLYMTTSASGDVTLDVGYYEAS